MPGLPLVEADETALAHALAVRSVGGEQRILDTQRDRITNADRKARFEFVRGAASSDAAERERWFRALEDRLSVNARPGSWMAEAVESSAACGAIRRADPQVAGHAAGGPPDRRSVLRCQLDA